MPVNLWYIIYAILNTWTWIKVSHVLLIWWVQFLNSSSIRKLFRLSKQLLRSGDHLWATLITVNKLITLRKNIELKSEIRLPCWFIPFLYTGGGALFIICIPTILFVLMERWTILESIYFGLCLHKLKEFQSYNKLVLWVPRVFLFGTHKMRAP